MATPSERSPAAQPRRETPRVALARLASAAATDHPAVVRLDGTRADRATVTAKDRLPGVTVMADAGRNAVALYVVATPADLHAAAGEIEASIRRGAASLGLTDDLGDIYITFTDLILPDEILRP